MSLNEIGYNAESESDRYKTTYKFSNRFQASSARGNSIESKRDQVEAILGIRIPYKFRI